MIDATDLMAGDVAILEIKDWISLLNKHYKGKDFIKKEDKNQQSLLKTVIKDSIPAILRPHAYLVYSGGFIYLKKCLVGEDCEFDYKQLYEKYQAQKKAGDLYMQEEKEKTGKFPIKNKPIILKTLTQIEKDLKRTYFPQDVIIRKYKQDGLEMDFFEEIEELEEEIEQLKRKTREVLICYALANHKVGYVQGMSSIAAAIVYNFFVAGKIFKNEAKEHKEDIDMIINELRFRLKFNAEEIFYVFAGLMEFFQLKKLFGEGLGLLQDRITSFENFLSEKMPELFDKMCGSGVSLSTLYP